MASENGISLKHLNGKMLKKQELCEKLLAKGVIVKSPKKSRRKSRKSSRKSRKPKKKSRKLNAYMQFAAKHRKKVMKKFQKEGKTGKDLI